MGIPDGIRDARAVEYVRKQKEKSFRGLLKLFNRGCDATGRPRYEDLCPPQPFRSAAPTPSSLAEPVDLKTPASASQHLVLPDAAPVIINPPPGLGWDAEELISAAPAMMQRSGQLTTDIQAACVDIVAGGPRHSCVPRNYGRHL